MLVVDRLVVEISNSTDVDIISVGILEVAIVGKVVPDVIASDEVTSSAVVSDVVCASTEDVVDCFVEVASTVTKSVRPSVVVGAIVVVTTFNSVVASSVGTVVAENGVVRTGDVADCVVRKVVVGISVVVTPNVVVDTVVN